MPPDPAIKIVGAGPPQDVKTQESELSKPKMRFEESKNTQSNVQTSSAHSKSILEETKPTIQNVRTAEVENKKVEEPFKSASQVPDAQKHLPKEPRRMEDIKEFFPSNIRKEMIEKRRESMNAAENAKKEGTEDGKNAKEESKDDPEQKQKRTIKFDNPILPSIQSKVDDELPTEMIIESDLALRRKIRELERKEQDLLEIGSFAIEAYEEIFDELDEELNKTEKQILDMYYAQPKTCQDELSILREKDSKAIQKEFEDCVNSVLRTDIVIRPSFRKDAYFKIHSFQWKSRQIHTYNLVNGEIETTFIAAAFNIPLFSRSIAIENGDIYLTGGQYKPYYLKTTFFFDEGSNTLEKKADMNLPRGDHSLIYLSGFIYAIGSYTHNKT